MVFDGTHPNSHTVNPIFAACDLLGSYMDQIMRDPQKAFKIYTAACDDYKFGRSCTKVGSFHFGGKGGIKRDVVM